MGNALFHLQIHKDGGLRGAVHRADRQRRHLGAEVPHPRALVARRLTEKALPGRSEGMWYNISRSSYDLVKKRQPRLPLLIWSAAACCRFSARFVVATQGILSPGFAQKKRHSVSVLCKLL